MFPRMFGVEIELNTKSYPGRCLERRYDKPGFASIVSEVRGYGINRQQKWLDVKMAPGWRAVDDPSCGSELVSPPMMDTKPIFQQLDYVQKSGLEYTMENCGLHVHVSGVDLDEDGVLAVAKFCRYFDRTIFSMMDKSRLSNRFCRLMGRSNDEIQKEILDPTRLDRYRGCNIESWFSKGTIEFRYSEGCDDPKRISTLVELYTKIVEWVKNHPGYRLRCKPNIKKKRAYLFDLLNISQTSRLLLEKKD